MAIFTINTKSGGIVEIDISQSGIIGRRLCFHIDQTGNDRNGEGDASILLNNDECKEIISILNNYLEFHEGKPFVVLAEPLIHPAVTITVDESKLESNDDKTS
jgi:hypothetical protein